MNPSNQTTRAQGSRLLAVGCPYVRLKLDGHHVVIEPIQLARLWDIAHGLGLEYDFPLDEMSSRELTEALVTAIEQHYRYEGKD